MAEGFRNDLIEAYIPLARSIAAQHHRRMNRMLSYDDLAAEAELHLIPIVRRWDGRGNIAGWIAHCLYLKLLEYCIRKPEWDKLTGGGIDHEFEDTESNAVESEPSLKLRSMFGGHGTAEEVIKRLAPVSWHQYRVAWLYFIKGLRVCEIANKIGLSQQAITNHLKTAKKNLIRFATGQPVPAPCGYAARHTYGGDD